MTTPVDIVNQVLSLIGTQSTVASLTENSTEAQHALIHYDPTRTDLLRKYRWGFARKQLALSVLKAQLGTPENPSGSSPQPPVPWIYEYGYPQDCLMARLILPLPPNLGTAQPLTTGTPQGISPIARTPHVRFAVAIDQDASGNNQKVILTNQQQAVLVYTADVNDPNLFDSLFQSALVGRLSARLVIPLSGDKALAKIAIDDGLRAEQEAAALDANERLTIINHLPDWLRARGYATDTMGWSDDMPSGYAWPYFPVDD